MNMDAFRIPEGEDVFWFSVSIISISFFITEVFGPHIILALLCITALVVLTINMFKHKLFKNVMALIFYVCSLIAGIGVSSYILYKFF
ncbi:MAG: hypothetical protein ACOCRL_00030 [Bacillota bacterium]